jgi:hypothetical protein
MLTLTPVPLIGDLTIRHDLCYYDQGTVLWFLNNADAI